MISNMKHLYAEDRKLLIKNFSRGKILDVGCYTMRFDLQDSIGIDVKLNDNVDILADAQFLPFQDESFNTVVAGEVIEHLVNPFSFVSEVIRVLKPDGLLLLTTPNPWSIYYMVSVSLGLSNVSDEPEHKYLWDLVLMERFLKGCGLKPEVTGYVNTHRNFLLKTLVRVKKKWSWHIFAVARKQNNFQMR